MYAVLLHEYGDVGQLEYESVPDPTPGPGEVLVKVIATSVNPVDYKLRSGAMQQRMPLELPAVLGRDVAGEVTALGSGVTDFAVGDKVMGLVNHSYAEYLTAKAEDLTLIPQGLDPVDAGTLPLVALTGTQLIETGVKPKSGEVVLVTGAVGSVGRIAVFVAKQHGALVIAGVRAKQKAEAQLLGADSVVALDDETEIAALPELDAIADTIGGDALEKLISKVKKSGRVASVVGKPEAAEKAGLAAIAVWAHPDSKRLHALAEEARAGRLKIPIERRFPLSEIRQAQTEAENGSHGKIAILP
jgi:NADPH:quinone reductase-like Zn-dependent oxidoreductase